MHLEILEESSNLTSDQIGLRNSLRAELLKILDEEEIYWYKRSHENWLLKVDNNTTFFHRVANGKKRKQTIYFWQDVDSKIYGDENLLKHATEYYKGLFGLRTEDALALDPELWPTEENVSNLENDELTRPFTEEVKVALFQMKNNNNAAGFPIEFFLEVLKLYQAGHYGTVQGFP
jgi:hypothetical protein